MTDAGEIERAVADFARGPNGGVIATGSALTIIHRDHIIALAARYKLPAVYYEDYYVAAGGLISYGANIRLTIGIAEVTCFAASVTSAAEVAMRSTFIRTNSP